MMNGLYQSKQVQSSTCLQLRVPYLCKSRRTIGSLLAWKLETDTSEDRGNSPWDSLQVRSAQWISERLSVCTGGSRTTQVSSVKNLPEYLSDSGKQDFPAFPTLNYEGMHPSTIRDADNFCWGFHDALKNFRATLSKWLGNQRKDKKGISYNVPPKLAWFISP